MITTPLRLTARAEPAATEATFIAAIDPLAFTAWPTVFAVRGGYIVVQTIPLHGGIRLRRLAKNLFIPAVANLEPALLPDEMTALTANQGLLILAGQILSFDANAPLPSSAFLALPAATRDDWQPFPVVPRLAESITRFEGPPLPPAAVIESLEGGAPENTQRLNNQPVPEAARPSAGSLLGTAAAMAGVAAAKTLAAAASVLGSGKLAEMAGALARKAAEQVPRITEKILGAQEAALRNVLKKLQSGDIEEALKHAPIAVGDPNAQSRVDSGSTLSRRNTRYDLSSLLGGGGGVASAWLGGGDVWAQLAAEYRRLAIEAVARGDHRRAAYLYGVLLRDLRSAANALASGGLHRDAAVLYRDKLNDPLAAAVQFERAGDYDAAIAIFESLEKYEDAAELLRRVDEEERARSYFLRAAAIHANHHRHLAAGDLVRVKLGNREMAEAHYRDGWEKQHDAVTCGHRLIDEMILGERWNETRAMFDAAYTRYQPPAHTDCGKFWNGVLPLREMMPTEVAEDVTDTARTQFAQHLRQHSHPASVANQFFGANWPPDVVRDALVASKGKNTALVVAEPVQTVPVGTVVATTCASVSRDVIIAGTKNVVCWRAIDGRTEPLMVVGPRRRILGLVASEDAGHVFVLYGEGADLYLRAMVYRDGRYHAGSQLKFDDVPGSGTDWRLMPWNIEGSAALISNPNGMFAYAGEHLNAVPSGEFKKDRGFVIHDPNGSWVWGLDVLFHSNWHDGIDQSTEPPWQPGIPEGSTLLVPTLEARTHQRNELIAAGVDCQGNVHWMWTAGMRHLSRPGYVCAALVNDLRVVAVSREGRLDNLRVGAGILEQVQSVALRHAVVAVHTLSGTEVLLIGRGGEVERMTIWASK